MFPSKQKTSHLAQRLLAEWKSLGLPVDQSVVVAAVSGGADSTALFLALDELNGLNKLELDIIVAHLDHGLRAGESLKDADWVVKLAKECGYKVCIGQADVNKIVKETKDNLEQAARRARYEFLARIAIESSANIILTAHTMDDQAETLLLRLMRGSGIEGLYGIAPIRLINMGENTLRLVRPLLWARRFETESYCHDRGIDFRLDEMNKDERFARVRVRQKLIPLLKSFNPRAVESIARTATLLREDAQALVSQSEQLLSEASVVSSDKKSISLRIDVLCSAPTAIRRRSLRQWITQERGSLRRIELVHILSIEKLLTGDRGGRIAELPGGSFVERRKGLLNFYREKS